MYTKEHLKKKMIQQGKVYSPWIHLTEDVVDSQFRKSQMNMLCTKRLFLRRHRYLEDTDYREKMS